MFLSYIFSIAKNAFQLIKNILIQIQCFFVFATFPEIRLSKFFLSKSFSKFLLKVNFTEIEKLINVANHEV